jgi:glucosamine-6-phosphate deaminase
VSDVTTDTRLIGRLTVDVLDDRNALGEAAAAAIAESIRTLLAEKETIRVVFAAAPSQTETLAALADADGIDWGRVEAFHMDEYVGIDPGAPQRFGNWLARAFFDRVPLRSIQLIDPAGSTATDSSGEAARYAALLDAEPIDIVLAGIGVTGHLAFNDPPVDFDEAVSVKVVELDRESRVQQVAEGLFARLDEVPTHAWTLTVPALLSAGEVFCVVPGELKAAAVRRALTGAVAPDSPASALRIHPRARLFLDRAASPFPTGSGE